MEKIKIIFIPIIFLISQSLFGTAQATDILIYNGTRYSLITLPMEPFFREFPEKRPPMPHTGLWRGYVATFEFIQNELWVVEITSGSRENIIKDILDGKDRMKIDWFTGLLVLQYGQRINYVHMGFASTFENYLVIEVNKGNFIRGFRMDHSQFVEFRERQLNHFREIAEYKELVERLRNGNRTDESIENFLRVFLIDFLKTIYDDEFLKTLYMENVNASNFQSSFQRLFGDTWLQRIFVVLIILIFCLFLVGLCTRKIALKSSRRSYK